MTINLYYNSDWNLQELIEGDKRILNSLLLHEIIHHKIYAFFGYSSKIYLDGEFGKTLIGYCEADLNSPITPRCFTKLIIMELIQGFFDCLSNIFLRRFRLIIFQIKNIFKNIRNYYYGLRKR